MDVGTAEGLLELVERASDALRGGAAADAGDEIETHLGDLSDALDTFLGEGRTDDGLRLAIALYRFWITRQRFADGAEWFDRALASPGGDELLRGRARYYAGFMPFWMGDDERAAALFDEALDAGRRVDDAPLVSQALGGLARVALRTDVNEGRRLARDALEVSEAAGDDAGRSNALHLLGVGAQIAGDLDEARRWMTERLALVRAQGNDFLVASEACNLSMVERQLGDLDAAESLAREALEIERRTGASFTTPFALSGLASIAALRGSFERAATLVGAAEAIMAAQEMAWPPDERPHYEHLLATLPTAMGGTDFEHARAAGEAMEPAVAVSLALA